MRSNRVWYETWATINYFANAGSHSLSLTNKQLIWIYSKTNRLYFHPFVPVPKICRDLLVSVIKFGSGYLPQYETLIVHRELFEGQSMVWFNVESCSLGSLSNSCLWRINESGKRNKFLIVSNISYSRVKITLHPSHFGRALEWSHQALYYHFNAIWVDK